MPAQPPAGRLDASETGVARAWLGTGSSPVLRWIWVRSESRSHLIPVSRIAITESGRRRAIFQAPDALKPEICGLPAFGPSPYIAEARLRSEGQPKRPN